MIDKVVDFPTEVTYFKIVSTHVRGIGARGNRGERGLETCLRRNIQVYMSCTCWRAQGLLSSPLRYFRTL